MINKLIRWWLKNKIEHLQRMADSHWISDAGTCRDGNCTEYWIGKSQGIDAALKLLELRPLDKK